MIRAKASGSFQDSSEDERLVKECLKGNQTAWADLVNKYKSLIFSIPLKYGFNREDASEIFQSVCLTLLAELPNLRQPRALGAWLIQTTSHKCFRWRREQQKYIEPQTGRFELSAEDSQLPERLLRQIEQEQILRESLNALPPACKRLIELLFFQDPPVSYDDAATLLGVAKGSIGATRMRCLERLRRSLEGKGLR